jgi:hypothetical protein
MRRKRSRSGSTGGAVRLRPARQNEPAPFSAHARLSGVVALGPSSRPRDSAPDTPFAGPGPSPSPGAVAPRTSPYMGLARLWRVGLPGPGSRWASVHRRPPPPPGPGGGLDFLCYNGIVGWGDRHASWDDAAPRLL